MLPGTCLLGRDRTAAQGHPEPFQVEMLPTCQDSSAVVCPQSYVCQWSYESHQSGMHNSTSEVITSVLPCFWPFRIIKHPVITHSEKWCTLFALLSVCVTCRCSTRQSYLLPWCGCQHKGWRFQRFWRVSWGQMSGDQLDLQGARRSSILNCNLEDVGKKIGKEDQLQAQSGGTILSTALWNNSTRSSYVYPIT